jgi:hypothetical protein
MLRLFVLALLLINGIYYGWSQGLLKPYGFAPEQQGEPQRLAQQVKPEGLKILSTQEMNRVEAQLQADLAPKECLQVSPLNEAQVSALRRVLEPNWPANSWQMQAVQIAPRWIVYMGKYPNEDMLVKKRGELNAMKLTLEPLQNPALEPGISLGGFPTQAEANAELAKLSLRGVRTAHVVQELQGGNATLLKLPAINDSLKARLGELKPALGSLLLKSCS